MLGAAYAYHDKIILFELSVQSSSNPAVVVAGSTRLLQNLFADGGVRVTVPLIPLRVVNLQDW